MENLHRHAPHLLVTVYFLLLTPKNIMHFNLFVLKAKLNKITLSAYLLNREFSRLVSYFHLFYLLYFRYFLM